MGVRRRTLTREGGQAALALVVCLLVWAPSVAAEGQEPTVLVSCPVNSTCLTFGFTFPGPGSLLEVEGTEMKNGYVMWAETVNNATDGIHARCVHTLLRPWLLFSSLKNT